MKGWKTILFNVLTGILLLVENMGVGFGLGPEIVSSILVIGNLVLRFLTTGPVAMASAKTVSKAKVQIETLAKKKGV